MLMGKPFEELVMGARLALSTLPPTYTLSISDSENVWQVKNKVSHVCFGVDVVDNKYIHSYIQHT